MATAATSLFSLSVLKTWCGVSGSTDDAVLALIGDAVSERIEAHTSRVWVTRTISEYYDGPRGCDASKLRLRWFPVVSLAEVKYRFTLLDDWTVLDSDEWVADPRLGYLYLTGLSFPSGPMAISITGDFGYGAQDSAGVQALDVYQAGLSWARALYAGWRNNVPAGGDVQVGDRSFRAAEMPADVKTILDRRRELRIGGLG